LDGQISSTEPTESLTPEASGNKLVSSSFDETDRSTTRLRKNQTIPDPSGSCSPATEDDRFMPRKKFGRNRKNRCRFCTREGCPRPAYVDYKDVGLLKKLCTNQSKIFSRKRSGNCAAFQRASSAAVKRARFMALLPYVGE